MKKDDIQFLKELADVLEKFAGNISYEMITEDSYMDYELVVERKNNRVANFPMIISPYMIKELLEKDEK